MNRLRELWENLDERSPRIRRALKSAAVGGTGASATVVLSLAGILPDWLQHPMVLPYVTAGMAWLANTASNLFRRFDIKFQ